MTAVHLIGFGSDYLPLANSDEIVDLAVQSGVRKATLPRGDVEKGPMEHALEKSPLVHDDDIASVAATVLTGDGHAGQEYLLTGPEALTMPERVAVLSAGLGRELTFVELGQDEVVASWREAWRTSPVIRLYPLPNG